VDVRFIAYNKNPDNNTLQSPPHLPSPFRTPRAGAAEDEGGASESKLGGGEAEDDPLPFVGEYDSTSTPPMSPTAPL
jgi:hypothetical protein